MCSVESKTSGCAFTLPVISRAWTIGQTSLVGAGAEDTPGKFIGGVNEHQLKGQSPWE